MRPEAASKRPRVSPHRPRRQRGAEAEAEAEARTRQAGRTEAAAAGDACAVWIARPVALSLLGFGALMLLGAWVLDEPLVGLATDAAWALPLLAGLLSTLGVWLWQEPGRLQFVCALASLLFGSYFAWGLLLVLTGRAAPGHDEAQSVLMWLPLAYLLFFATWPRREALAFNGLLLAGVGAVSVASTPGLLFAQALLAHALFIAVLFCIARARPGLGAKRLLGGDPAEQPVEQRIHDRTRRLRGALLAAESASRAKSRFLATLSRELRAPLHAVLGAAGLLQARPHQEAEASQLAATIESQGRRLLTLIDQVLDLARIGAAELRLAQETFHLGLCLEHALDTVRDKAERRGLVLLLDVAPQIARHPLRNGDALRLSQACGQLLANAVKVTERGSVRLSVEPDGAGGAHALRFTVQDTGPGLPPEAMQRLCEPFFEGPASDAAPRASDGLGLTISRELIGLMGGELRFQGGPGRGTRASFSLVLAPAEARAPAPPSPRPPCLAGVRVLLADDDGVSRRITARMLALEGSQVTEVRSAGDAIGRLRGEGADLVLMAWRTPAGDAMRATRRIRDGAAGPAQRSIPIIGLSANALEADREACLAGGMDSALTKPVGRDELVRAVQQWHRPPPAGPKGAAP